MNPLKEDENSENPNDSQTRVFGKNLTNIDRKEDFANESEDISNVKPITNDSQNIELEEIKETDKMAKITTVNKDLDMDLEENLPDPKYMERIQNDINQNMRAILIDWLVDVHLKYLIVPETLYLAVNLVDRYLSHFTVSRRQLQLVGITAMMIASKYEDIYPPNVWHYENLTDGAYTVEEILDMEEKMLELFDSKVTMTTSFGFLKRFARICHFNKKSFNLARYLLELALIKYKMLEYLPKYLACSAIFLVNKLEKIKDAWPEYMEKLTKYNDVQLRPAARDMCLLLRDAGKEPLLQAVKRKFSCYKFLEVGKIDWSS